jgi:hypothetical protein
MDVKKFVDELTFPQQEALLTELNNRGRLAVHVASREETVGIDDVYDNSGGRDPILTILLIDHVEN